MTIFFTYSFDPLFFERIPLSDLKKGGSRRILIVADAGQVQKAMGQCLSQLAYLGRLYVLAETVSARTFHPKLIARLSAAGGRVWVGSGNLTYPGWGGHQELGATWSIGPKEDDRGLWLDSLLAAVGAAVRSSVFEDQVEIIRETIGWLKTSDNVTQASPILFGTPDRPLAPQLADRWKNRRFDELRLCTGSTDKDGAFLLWTHQTFGVKRAIVCVSPTYASFDAARLKKLPLDVHIVKPKDGQMMHAKFFWFSGAQGCAAVAGSANCSAAAWLAGSGFGNFELVIPYDSPTEADFKSIMAVFKGAKLAPEKVLLAPSGVSDETKGPEHEPFQLVSLRLRATGGVIEAILDPPPPADSRVKLTIEAARRRATVALTQRGAVLIARLPPEFEVGPGTAFAAAHIETAGKSIITAPRWIDNDAALARASSGSSIEPGLGDLYRRRARSSDQQKILEAVYAVSQSLLRGDGSATALTAARAKAKRDQKPETEEEADAPAVDPAAIVRGLKELKAARDAKGHSGFTPYGGSLYGVMALLFGREEDIEDEIDLSHEAWMGDNPELASDDAADIKGNLGSPPASPPPPPRPPPPETTAETARRFHEQIDDFLRELGHPDFAQQCEAERLVEALAFPLLVCVRGYEGGWLSPTALASVAARVVDVMLVKTYGPNRLKGLFRVVQDRYAQLHRQEEFLRAVGEGTLWSALLASLSTIIDAPARQMIRQASALSQVFACKELVALATPEHLSALVQSLVIPHAEFSLTDKATHIEEALEELIALLRIKERAIYAQQGNGRRWHNAGALLWSSRWGWSVTPSGQAQSSACGYIDVELAAQNDPDILKALNHLRQVMLAVPAVQPEPIVLRPGVDASDTSAASVPHNTLTSNAALPGHNSAAPSAS
ncbi:MAG: hypothetical protein ACLQDA_01855 [Terracidiphilus sp.]